MGTGIGEVYSYPATGYDRSELFTHFSSMGNQMSPDSRRANFIVDKEFYAGLEEKASGEGVSVGELIRRALEKEFPEIEAAHPVTQIKVAGRRVIHMPKETWEKVEKMLKTTKPTRRKRPGGKKKKTG